MSFCSSITEQWAHSSVLYSYGSLWVETKPKLNGTDESNSSPCLPGKMTVKMVCVKHPVCICRPAHWGCPYKLPQNGVFVNEVLFIVISIFCAVACVFFFPLALDGVG